MKKISEENRAKLVDNLSTIMSSVFGITGAAMVPVMPQMAIPIATIQAAAYLPGVISIGIKKTYGNSVIQDEIQKELDECSKTTIKKYAQQLETKYPDQKKDIQLLLARIEYDWSQYSSIQELKNIITEDCEREKTIGNISFSASEIKNLTEQLIEIFLYEASDYPKLNQTIVFSEVQLIRDEINDIKEAIPKSIEQETQNYKMGLLYRTDLYRDGWDKDMFLHRIPGGKSGISLHALYENTDECLFPSFSDSFKQQDTDLKTILTDDQSLGDGMVVFGPPGIGKSTVITWLCNARNKDNILVYTLQDVFYDDNAMDSSANPITMRYVLERTGLKIQDLKDKILVLDGLDEVLVLSASQKEQFIIGLFKQCRTIHCRLIITCRENYITSFKKIDNELIRHIHLIPWEKKKIKEFTKLYCSICNTHRDDCFLNILCSKTSLYGIPLILYMVLALNIDIGGKENEVDVYDKVFSLEGGIFDKPYDPTLEIPMEIRKKILEISREIGFKMFESGNDSIQDPFKLFPELIENDFYQDYFKIINHTEGVHSLSFIHRSMFEYFAVDYFVVRIERLLEKPLFLEKYVELSEELAHFFKMGYLEDPLISLESNEKLLPLFLKTKLIKLFNKKGLIGNSNGKKNLYYWWESGCAKVIEEGVVSLAYKNKTCHEKKSIDQEKRGFTNIIYMLRMMYDYLIDDKSIKMFTNARGKRSIPIKDKLADYFRLLSPDSRMVDYSYMDLHDVDFYGVSLYECRFDNSFLENAYFGKGFNYVYGPWPDLRHCSFNDCYLRGAHFEGADLRGGQFVNADLTAAHMDNCILNEINLYQAKIESVSFSSINKVLPGNLPLQLNKGTLRKAHYHHVKVDGKRVERSVFQQKYSK